MGPSVIIKTNAYGLIIRLAAEPDFEELLQDVRKKFTDAAKFFRNSQMAVTFKGRSLSDEEEFRLVTAITECAHMQIVCLVDESEETAETYKEAVIRTLAQQSEHALVHRGTVAAGEKLKSDMDLVVLGDINPGAEVITCGSLIALGCVMGSVTVGYGGHRDTFAAALILKPAILRIADKAARSAITKRSDTGEYAVEPRIGLIREERIVLEKLKGSVFKALQMHAEKE